MEQRFGEWMTEVLACVRFRPDRRAIQRELEDAIALRLIDSYMEPIKAIHATAAQDKIVLE